MGCNSFVPCHFGNIIVLVFSQGWDEGGAWSRMGVSRLLFCSTHSVTAGVEQRNSDFCEKGSVPLGGRKILGSAARKLYFFCCHDLNRVQFLSS